MNPEERIAQLEAELARERASRERLERALEDAMAAVRAAADDRKAIASRRAADRERKNASRARRLAEVAASRDLCDDMSRDCHVTTPPSSSSPFPSSFPPSTEPPSPYPLSFPPSSPPSPLPPASQAGPRNELRLEPQEQPRKRKAREEKPTDPRHRPLLEQLVAQGWELGGPRGARAVADLLSRAGETTPAGEAPGEVLRRAGHALQKRRTAPTLFPAVAELWELVTHWQHFAEPFRAPAGRGPAPPSDFEATRPYVEPAWLDPNFGKE